MTEAVAVYWMGPQMPDNGPVTSQDKWNTCLLKEDVSDRHLMTYKVRPHPSSYLIFQKAPEHKGKLIPLSASHRRGRVGHPGGCVLSFKDYNGLLLPSWKRTQLNSAH